MGQYGPLCCTDIWQGSLGLQNMGQARLPFVLKNPTYFQTNEHQIHTVHQCTITPLETQRFQHYHHLQLWLSVVGTGRSWTFPRLRQLLTQELAQNPSGRVGLRMWRDYHPDPDVAFLGLGDQNMLGMLKVLRRL